MSELPLIMVAPNGARRSKADHAALPLSIAETVAEAHACYAAGAGALHLHVRDAEGHHSLDACLYREALTELKRAVPEMRVQITTEAAGVFDVEDQIQTLAKLRPSWASISVREIAREPELADRIYGTCVAQGTEVQHILYDAADVALFMHWRAEGIIRPEQQSVLLVLGRYSDGQVSSPGEIAPLVAALPEGTSWMLCAFGPIEHACLLEAVRLGGACRVGLENSLVDARDRPWRDNAASVAALRRLLEVQSSASVHPFEKVRHDVPHLSSSH